MDLDKLETVWGEMRETQYLTEEQIKKLKELLGSFNKINTNIAQNEENAYKNIEILKEIIVKLNNIAQNNSVFVDVLKENKDELSNLLKELKDYKKRLELDITTKIDETLKKTETKLETYNKLAEEMAYTLNNVVTNKKQIVEDIAKNTQELGNEIIKGFDVEKNKIAKEFDKRRNEIVNNLRKETNKTIANINKELKQKTFFQKWGIAITSGLLGIAVGVGIIFFNFKNDIVFSLKYSSVCYNSNKKPYKCYAVPPQVASINAKEDKYLIQK